MRKYLEISKLLFKAQITWRFDVIMTVIGSISKILFAYILWGAIFSQRETVAGFTFSAMLSYYLISSFLSQIDMSYGVGTEIGDRIKGGTFSKYMVVPVNTQGYFIAQAAGTMSFYLIFELLSVILWAFIFRIKFTVTSDPLVIFSAVLMILLGLLFMVQLNYFLGILAFKFQEITFFLMIKEHFISFVTGALVPLSLLPEAVVTVMRFLPFYYVNYLPSMLLIGRNQEEALPGLLILVLWLLAMLLLGRFTYQKMRKEYDGVGI